MAEEKKELATGQAFSLMDRLDDELILAELKGEILEAYVYDFEVAGRQVRGLSKAGIDAACAEVARRGEAIRELEIEWEITEEAGLFAVKAARFAIMEDGTERQLDAVIGTKRQPKTLTLRTGESVEDPFWFEKGSAKAGRNARRRLLPEKLIVELVKAYIDEGKVKRKTLPPKRPRGNKYPEGSAQWFVEELKSRGITKVEALRRIGYDTFAQWFKLNAGKGHKELLQEILAIGGGPATEVAEPPLMPGPEDIPY